MLGRRSTTHRLDLLEPGLVVLGLDGAGQADARQARARVLGSVASGGDAPGRGGDDVRLIDAELDLWEGAVSAQLGGGREERTSVSKTSRAAIRPSYPGSRWSHIV